MEIFVSFGCFFKLPGFPRLKCFYVVLVVSKGVIILGGFRCETRGSLAFLLGTFERLVVFSFFKSGGLEGFLAVQCQELEGLRTPAMCCYLRAFDILRGSRLSKTSSFLHFAGEQRGHFF